MKFDGMESNKDICIYFLHHAKEICSAMMHLKVRLVADDNSRARAVR
jgi:hypothetical protein